MRPDQDFGIVTVLDLPLLSSKPVVGSGGELAPESRPGHTVRRHLLTILKEAGSVSEMKQKASRERKVAERRRR